MKLKITILGMVLAVAPLMADCTSCCVVYDPWADAAVIVFIAIMAFMLG